MATATKTFEFELITPEGALVKTETNELIALSESGEIGILPNHADLKTKIISAPLRYKNESGKFEIIAVLGGILEVEKNKVIVLTDFAEKATDIDEAEAHKAAELARAELQTHSDNAPKTKEDRNLLIAENKLRRELVRLKAAQLNKQF